MSAVNFDPIIASGVNPIIINDDGLYVTCTSFEPVAGDDTYTTMYIYDSQDFPILISSSVSDYEYDWIYHRWNYVGGQLT